MIHTYFYDAKGIGDDYYSLNIHCHVSRVTGDPCQNLEYYKSIYSYDEVEEERMFRWYRMCVFYVNEESLFGLINYGTHVEFRDKLVYQRFVDIMSYLPVGSRRRAGRSRCIRSTIRLRYRDLEFDPDYGCYTFTERGPISFAERVKWIAEEFVVK
jgi:hypothetical protein